MLILSTTLLVVLVLIAFILFAITFIADNKDYSRTWLKIGRISSNGGFSALLIAVFWAIITILVICSRGPTSYVTQEIYVIDSSDFLVDRDGNVTCDAIMADPNDPYAIFPYPLTSIYLPSPNCSYSEKTFMKDDYENIEYYFDETLPHIVVQTQYNTIAEAVNCTIIYTKPILKVYLPSESCVRTGS